MSKIAIFIVQKNTNMTGYTNTTHVRTLRGDSNWKPQLNDRNFFKNWSDVCDRILDRPINFAPALASMEDILI